MPLARCDGAGLQPLHPSSDKPGALPQATIGSAVGAPEVPATRHASKQRVEATRRDDAAHGHVPLRRSCSRESCDAQCAAPLHPLTDARPSGRGNAPPQATINRAVGASEYFATHNAPRRCILSPTHDRPEGATPRPIVAWGNAPGWVRGNPRAESPLHSPRSVPALDLRARIGQDPTSLLGRLPRSPRQPSSAAAAVSSRSWQSLCPIRHESGAIGSWFDERAR